MALVINSPDAVELTVCSHRIAHHDHGRLQPMCALPRAAAHVYTHGSSPHPPPLLALAFALPRPPDYEVDFIDFFTNLTNLGATFRKDAYLHPEEVPAIKF